MFNNLITKVNKFKLNCQLQTAVSHVRCLPCSDISIGPKRKVFNKICQRQYTEKREGERENKLAKQRLSVSQSVRVFHVVLVALGQMLPVNFELTVALAKNYDKS